jgi:hypothetical protein
MSSTITFTCESSGISWLGSASRPIVANTAVRPSSTGRPATISAPNVSSRTTSVTGSESIPALPRSSAIAPWSSFSELASPNWSIVTERCAFAYALTAAWTGTTLSCALSRSVSLSSNGTSTVLPSFERMPSWPCS